MQTLDELATAGRILRKKLQQFSFGLDDEFCDAHDLEIGFTKSKMPESAVSFSGFLNIDREDFFWRNEDVVDVDESDSSEDEDNSNAVDGEIILPKKKRYFSSKSLKAHAIFQTIFYAVNNGCKKASLQVSLAHSIYEKCKSKGLLKSTNVLAFSISYTELRKFRNCLGARTVHLNEEQFFPLPVQSDSRQFLIAATDNMNHRDKSSLSGQNSNHDSYMMLFQNASNQALTTHDKLKPTSLKNQRNGRGYLKELPCQVPQPFERTSSKQRLPPFFSQKFEYEQGEEEKVISLIRENAVDELISCSDNASGVPTWAGINHLISTAKLTMKQVRFFPLIPHPITNIETVYTSLKNLKYEAQRVLHFTLPVACDEGVYSLVVQIWLEKPEFFQDIFPMLGTFHMAKAALICAVKYARGSGIEDAFIETQIFGPKTLESVLNGSHYYRTFCGLMMLSEAIEKLKMEAFWSKHWTDHFQESLKKLSKSKDSLSSQESISSRKIMEEI